MLKNLGSLLRYAKGPTLTTENVLPIVMYSSAMSQRKVRDPNELKFLPKKDFQDYMAFMPKFIEDATSKDILLDQAPVNRRVRRLLEYMLPSGKHLRQHILIFTYKNIEDHHGTLTPEKMEEMHKLCWCLELYNTGNAILDDILDDHDVRRNKPTWYKLVGSVATNDMLLVFTCLNGIIKKYFRGHPKFEEIEDLFHTPVTPVALSLELETTNFEDFTMEKCEEIAWLRTAHYCVDQPFLLATLFANKEPQLYDWAKKVFFYLGNLYSAQNDVLDVYGKHITGKGSRDIQDNNCTYLIVLARQKANDSQLKTLKDCYGKKDEKCVETVIRIFDELDILGEYYKLEDLYLQKAAEEIRKIDDGFSRSLIEKLAYVQSYGAIGVPPY